MCFLSLSWDFEIENRGPDPCIPDRTLSGQEVTNHIFSLFGLESQCKLQSFELGSNFLIADTSFSEFVECSLCLLDPVLCQQPTWRLKLVLERQFELEWGPYLWDEPD